MVWWCFWVKFVHKIDVFKVGMVDAYYIGKQHRENPRVREAATKVNRSVRHDPDFRCWSGSR